MSGSVYATAAFWRGAAERAVKTFAQSLLAVLGVGVAGILEVDWVGALSAAGLATLVSLLTSLSQPEFTAGQPAAEAVEDEPTSLPFRRRDRRAHDHG